MLVPPAALARCTLRTLSAMALAIPAARTACAHDLNPAPFRGLPGTTYQAWDFLTPAIGAPDGFCPPQNVTGMPSGSVSAGALWLPQFAGIKGVWCLVQPGQSLSFGIPNAGGPPFYLKTVYVQMTLHFHSTTSSITVDVNPPGGGVITGVQDLPVPGKGPAWVHRTVAICLFTCPPFEVVSLTAKGLPPFDHVDVSEVIIETSCDADQCYEPPLPVAPGDYDGDGIPDNWDNAPGVPNPNQSDCDGDGIGDVSDTCKICDQGATPEPEPCGTDQNGGCNHPLQAVTPLPCNEQYCGTLWADQGSRDTDWYVLDLPDVDGDLVGDLIVEVCTALPTVVFVLNDDCTQLQLFAAGDADLDRPLELHICLPAPKKYFVFLAPGTLAGGVFSGYPCFGLNNQYWLRAYCAEPCSVCGIPGGNVCCVASPNGTPGCEDGACCATVCAVDPFCCKMQWDGICAAEAKGLCADICCTGDVNGDGVVDGADLGILLANWGSLQSVPGDLNGDCIVDGADLGILLAQWGPC